LQSTVELVLERLTVKPSIEMRFEWRGIAIVERLTQERILEMVPASLSAVEIENWNAWLETIMLCSN